MCNLLEVDLVGGDYVVEVKVNRRPYEGFAQAYLASKLLQKRNAFVVHLVDGVTEEFTELTEEMVSLTGITCYVVDLNSKSLIPLKPKFR